MMRMKWLFMSLAPLALLCAFGSSASDLTRMPDNAPRPLPVAVSLSILDVQAIKENLNTMFATVELHQSWLDPRLAFDPIKQGSDRLVYTDREALSFLDQHWNPHIVITNLVSTTGTPELGVEVLPDGTVTEIRTINAGFYIRSDYSDFPFDRQSFPIDVASDRYNRGELALLFGSEEKAASAIDRSVHLAQWSLLGLAGERSIRTGWDGTSFEHLSINVLMKRKTLQYAPQIFLPYLFIMMAPLLVLVIKIDDVFQKATLLSGAALATIALQFSVAASFPEVVLTDNIVSRMFWLGYAFLVVMLLLIITVYNTTLNMFKDTHVIKELRFQLHWMPAVIFLVLLVGTILAPILRQTLA
jgi:hypothetical protein